MQLIRSEISINLFRSRISFCIKVLVVFVLSIFFFYLRFLDQRKSMFVYLVSSSLQFSIQYSSLILDLIGLICLLI